MWRRLFWAVIAAALCPASASAGSLTVDPVQVVINDDRRTAAVRIVNKGAAPSTIRISPLAWSQIDGKDVRESTPDLIASPPIVTIGPGATQIVRLGFRNPAQRSGSYRLIIEETPELTGSGVRVALRLDLPVFARLKAEGADAVHWSAWRGADGFWIVEATNARDGYVRLTSANIAAGTGLQQDQSIAPGVVLPRSSRRWMLAKTPAIADRTLWARINREQGSARQDLASR